MSDLVFGADDPKNKDLTIIKVCDNCGRKYHPRRNSYQATSRFCTQECVKQARRRKAFRPLGIE